MTFERFCSCYSSLLPKGSATKVVNKCSLLSSESTHILFMQFSPQVSISNNIVPILGGLSSVGQVLARQVSQDFLQDVINRFFCITKMKYMVERALAVTRIY